MTSGDVLAVMDALSAAGCRAWLDGGWAVDAIIGEETRKHDDLDLVGELGAVEAVRQALASLGYRLETDERPVRVVFVGASDRSVDLHTVVFDQGGGGVQPQPDGGIFRYPPEGFGGMGRITGRVLPCLSAEVQLSCHVGYEPDEKDRHDVA
ncbi:MAG: amino acid transporter [Chloroflexi bacterium]|nr:amino acid transporter [Chloroflexota bacterium]